MFCKICSDSGNSDFASHNVRDRTGKVVCPVLLSTVCRNCGQSGHTVKYCTSGYDNNVKKFSRVSFATDAKSNTPLKNLNMFSCFDECQECNDDGMVYDLNNIIWGVGQKDMIGVSWGDL